MVAPCTPVFFSPIPRVVHGRREVSGLSMVSRLLLSRGLVFLWMGCVNLLGEGVGHCKLFVCFQKGPCACTYEVVHSKGEYESQGKLGSLDRCCLAYT
jgi:hypothetical protein